MADLCACEHPTCPELPLCDGCDPPRVATWHGHGVYACDACVDPLLDLTPGRPLLVTCAGWQGEMVVCLAAPLRPDEEAELRKVYTWRPPYWVRDWNNLALLSTLDAARRERDAARVAYEQEHAIRVNLGAQLLEAGNTITTLRQQIAELRANVDPSR